MSSRRLPHQLQKGGQQPSEKRAVRPAAGLEAVKKIYSSIPANNFIAIFRSLFGNLLIAKS